MHEFCLDGRNIKSSLAHLCVFTSIHVCTSACMPVRIFIQLYILLYVPWDIYGLVRYPDVCLYIYLFIGQAVVCGLTLGFRGYILIWLKSISFHLITEICYHASWPSWAWLVPGWMVFSPRQLLYIATFLYSTSPCLRRLLPLVLHLWWCVPAILLSLLQFPCPWTSSAQQYVVLPPPLMPWDSRGVVDFTTLLQQLPQSKKPSQAYTKNAMGPPQVSFTFKVRSSNWFVYICWCLLCCLLSISRFHCGCHFDLWGLNHWGKHHCSPSEHTQGRHLCIQVMIWDPWQECNQWLLPALVQAGVAFYCSAVLQPFQQYSGTYSFGGSAVTQCHPFPSW